MNYTDKTFPDVGEMQAARAREEAFLEVMRVTTGAAPACPHNLGFNCRACYPAMPLTENHYRSRK